MYCRNAGAQLVLFVLWFQILFFQLARMIYFFSDEMDFSKIKGLQTLGLYESKQQIAMKH